MSEERGHKRFSASQADRNALCLGSSNLLARVPPRPSSVYAIEGTNAHTVLIDGGLANGIRDAREAHRDYSVLFFQDLDDGRNDFYFAVQMALDYVYSILDENPDAVMYLEREVNPPVENAPGEAAGYCDICIHIPSIRTAMIIDYKHGAGVAKDPTTRQIKQYAAGFLYEDNALIDPNEIDTVTLVIVQPRAFHKDGPIRDIDVTPYAIWEYLEELDDVIAQAIRPDAPLTPGEEQCRFCDAATICPAREAQALQVAVPAYRQIRDMVANPLPAPGALDLNRLATIRAHADTLRKWLDSVDDHCLELLRSGHVVPGAKLVEAAPKRSWYGDEPDVARKLAAMLGERHADAAVTEMLELFKKYPALDTLYNFKLVPLTTAEKLVVEEYKRRVARGQKKHAAEQARQSFAFLTLKQTSGALTMVDDDDPRPAVNKLHNTFAQISGALNRPS